MQLRNVLHIVFEVARNGLHMEVRQGGRLTRLILRYGLWIYPEVNPAIQMYSA